MSSSKPLATVNKAVQLALLRGADEDDVVTVNISGTVKFGAASIKSHEFTLKLTALDANATLTSADNLALGGPTIFDKVAIDMGSNWKYFAFGGNSVTFDGRFTHDWVDIELGRGSAELDLTEEVNININSFIRKIGLGNTWYSVTYNENCNINFNGTNGDPNAEFIINLGAMQDLGSTNFNKALNITNERVEKFAFTKGHSLNIGTNGFFNFINNATGTTIDRSSLGLSSGSLSKTWVLNNKSTLAKVKPTGTKGVFAVDKGYIATATSTAGRTTKSSDGKLTLSAGQYSLTFTACNNHVYSDSTDMSCNNCGAERKTYQSEIVKCTIYPALASGTINGQVGLTTLENCVTSHSTRLYTVNTYKVEDISEITVGEDCRIFVQFFDEVGNYIGGSSWQYTGRHIMAELSGADKATYFKVTFSSTQGGNDLVTPSAEDIRFTLYHVYDNEDDNTCNTCGANREVFVPCIHEWGEYIFNNNANCQTLGTETRTCSLCYITETRRVPGTAAGHIYDTQCDDTCNTCGETRSAKHNYSWIIDQQPNCVENGYKHAECSLCGRTINNNTVIAATGNHSYSNNCDATCNVCGGTRVVTHNFKSATCNAPKTCRVCGLTEGMALGHNYDNVCDADCNRCGALRATQGHKYFNEVDKICDICGSERQIIGQHLIEEDGKIYYYLDGEKQNITDLVKIDGVWYYINEGVWDTSIDTLHKINGKWFLIKGGIWKATTGLEEYKGKTFYVVGGKWKSDVTDLKWIDGKWYYIQYGKWNQSIDTLHKINGKWFLIKKGIWNKTTGLVDYQGKTFLVNGGKWDSSVNTLYKQGSKYLAIKSGKVYEGKAIIAYNGKNIYVNDGYAQLTFSGKVTINNKTYTIKYGKVVK